MLLNLYDQGILIKSVDMDIKTITIFLNRLLIDSKYSKTNAAKATNKVLQEVKDCGSATIHNPALNSKIEIIGG